MYIFFSFFFIIILITLNRVITRWGTQYRCVTCVNKSRLAFATWASHQAVQRDATQKATIASCITTITNPKFWRRLAQLELILAPLHEAQKTSEANRASIQHVAGRWAEIASKWKAIELVGSEEQEDIDWDQLQALHAKRYKTQTSMVHHAATALDPSRIASPITHGIIPDVIDFLKDRCTQENQHEVERQFLHFRNRYEDFASGVSDSPWHHQHDPIDFWMYVGAKNPNNVLAPLAVRLFHCLANSVPSERAFSAHNFIHTDNRNRLSPENANKATFVYYNTKAIACETMGWDFISDQRNEELEEELFQALGY